MSVRSTIRFYAQHPSLRSVGMYTFTNFFSKGASFLLLFVFTNPLYITPAENGLLSLFSNSLLFLMPFLSMGIVHSVSADYFKLNTTDFRDFFSTSFLLPVMIMGAAMLAMGLGHHWLNRTYGFPWYFSILIPLITFFIFCNEQLLSMARNRQEPQVYLKANVSKTIIELGLSVVLVVFFAWRWQGRVAGILAAYSLLGVYAFYYFRQHGYLFGRIRQQYLKSELLYALPIIALQACIFTQTASDKFFLSAYTNDNNTTVGIYSIACIFASVLNVLSTGLQQYIFPGIYQAISTNSMDAAYFKKQWLLYAGILTAALLIWLVLVPFIFSNFINVKYKPALRYSYLLGIGVYCWAMAYFFYSFLLYHKEKRKLLLLSLSGIAVSLLCNAWLIPRWLDAGAAWASVISYGSILLGTLLITQAYWLPLLRPRKHS
jgi:O-antigen/teichoic acid export membrane protein